MFKRHSTLRSPQLAKKKKKQFWVKFYIAIFFVCVFVIIPPIISHLTYFKIVDIDISGNEVITRAELDKYIREKISGNYFKVFSKSNILLYPRNHIERDILNDFTRISEVDISFKNLTSIKVRVLERRPFAVWCESEQNGDRVSFGNDCYFMGNKGVVFSEAPDFSNNVYVRYHGFLDSFVSPISQQYLSESDFKRVDNFIKQLSLLDLQVNSVFAYTDGDVDLFISSGGKIITSTREDFSVTFENLQSLLNDKISIPDKNEFIKNLEYVDLRFGKKLFFKLR